MVENVQFAKAMAILDIWMCFTEAPLHLEDSSIGFVPFLKPGSQNLFEVRQGPCKTGLNDFEHWKNWSQRHCILVTGERDTNTDNWGFQALSFVWSIEQTRY